MERSYGRGMDQVHVSDDCNNIETRKHSYETTWGDVAALKDKMGQLDNKKNINMERLDETRVANLETIHRRELEIISENSDCLGYNIDSKYIIWPERYKEAKDVENACKMADGTYDYAELARVAKKYSEKLDKEITPEKIKEAMEGELSKDKLLDDTLANLPDGTRFRINPHAPQSAFRVIEDEKIINPAGELRFQLDDKVMAQVQKIRRKTKDSEMLVVMNQIHEGEDGKLNSNIPEDPSEYIALCKSFVEQSGYSEQAGKGLVLELCNECNMCHKHGELWHQKEGQLFRSEAFADHVDPDAYANFYYDTATTLKTVFPELKLSLTGVAFSDSRFIKSVTDRIRTRQEQEQNTQKLIDIISFHPYRTSVEAPTQVVDGENFGENTGQSFDSQLEELRKIAEPFGAEVTVGEISFCQEGQWGYSIDEVEQVRNAEHGRENGYFSYLWPGENIVNYEKPEDNVDGFNGCYPY